MNSSVIFLMLFINLSGFISSALSHTWVEQITLLTSHYSLGNSIGYPRGNVLRTSDAFLELGDQVMTHLISPNGREDTAILPPDPICMASQHVMNQTSGSPMLQAPAGSHILLRYQENGHVTLPVNNPGKDTPGLVFVYGTSQALPNDTLQSIHKVWDPMGTGGDERGRLLTQCNFDDGTCYQPNSGQISQQRQKKYTPDPFQGQNRWCRNEVEIPDDIGEGLYTIYWVWDWPTSPGTPGAPKGKAEIYTTCIDIDIVRTFT